MNRQSSKRPIAVPLNAWRTTKGLGLMAALIGLCGCVSEAGPSVTLEQSVATPVVVALAQSNRSASTARATLPVEAGRILRIDDSGSAHAFRQDIVLDGSAIKGITNRIAILSNIDALEARDSPLAIKPTEASIRAEMNGQFPAIVMNVATRAFSNAYGPYGLALGRGPNETRCIYAWQWIDGGSSTAKSGVGSPVSLRVTLCRKGQTFDDMASLVDRIAIGSDAATPVLVLENRKGLGSDHRHATAPVRHVKVAHRKPSRDRPRAQTATMQDNDNGGPLPAAMPNASSQRYMGPVAGMAAGGVPQGLNDFSNGASVSSSVAPPLSQDLPPQAYLGPRATGLKVATTPGSSSAQ